MQKGVLYSLIGHLIVGLLFIFGLPSFSKRYHQDFAVVTDVVPISEITNVKVKKKKKKVKKAKKKTTKKKAPKVVKKKEVKKKVAKKPKPKPKKQPKKVEKKEKVPTKKKVVKKKPEPKKEVKKAKKKAKTLDDIFDQAILKSVEEEKKEKADEAKKDKESKDVAKSLEGKSNKEYNKELPMTISEINAIKSQITKNWNTTTFSGAKSKGMNVVVRIKLDIDGNVLSVIPNTEHNSSPYYLTFVESAVRAVKSASPIERLAREKYATWQEIEFRFDSSGMIY